jgi:hypothetical protein
MRNKLDDNEKKQTISFCVNPEIVKVLNEKYKNKSRYIEGLIYKDMVKNKLLDKKILL